MLHWKAGRNGQANLDSISPPTEFKSMKLFSRTGCYSEVHNTLRLVLVIFNSNLVVEGNETALEDDPLGIWSWLRMELLKAREKDLKVYLIMSVPPGVFESGLAIPGIHWFHQKHNRKYIVMVREFRDIIMGQFAGHHHTDTFRVFYNKNVMPDFESRGPTKSIPKTSNICELSLYQLVVALLSVGQ
ncbi:acid sphingomyelinase-like phosphodiesterase 3b [Schistocerca gregaria]|uniref:acid sphingomyelinase-like phosphodiesterase 3b n=1 Tax=Schistocerca gregaria TaxID=7010 RepID=UPI00211E7B34|nr:acid sphingomyelinase-like phosphodiesterase 3b [Schistocerca gregaria]